MRIASRCLHASAIVNFVLRSICFDQSELARYGWLVDEPSGLLAFPRLPVLPQPTVLVNA